MNSLRFLPLFFIINITSCSLPNLNDPETLKEAKQKAVSLSTINKEFKYGMVWLYVDEDNESYTGWVKETHSNHSIKKLGYLKDGKKEGLWMDWYENGLQESKIMWHQDRLSGDYLQWFINENPHVIGQTLDGEMDGEWKEYYSNGNLQAHSFNDLGKCISKKIWRINGKLCTESNVENGNGHYIEYKENGEVPLTRTYKNGVEIK